MHTKIEERRRTEDRTDALAKEARDHKRAAYETLSGALQQMMDEIDDNTSAVLSLSALSYSDWEDSSALASWVASRDTIMESYRSLRNLGLVYGSEEVRKHTRFLSAALRTVDVPHKYADSGAWYFESMRVDGNGVVFDLATANDPSAFRVAKLVSMDIYQDVLRWMIDQMRHELISDGPPEPLAFNPVLVRAAVTGTRLPSNPAQ